MKKLLLILLCLPMIGFGQKGGVWKFQESDNPFDGKFKTAFVVGYGSDYPYKSPSLCIQKTEKSDDFINFYISGAGYHQKTGVSIKWVFDLEPNTIYISSNIYTSKDGKTLFLDDFMNPEGGFKIEGIEFIEKLKQANKVNVRISDEYSSNDLSFSLIGSTRAINLVIPVEYKNNRISELNAERDKLTNIESELSNKLKSYLITDEENEDIIRQVMDYTFMGYSVSDIDTIIITKDRLLDYYNVLLLDVKWEVLYEHQLLEIPSLYERYIEDQVEIKNEIEIEDTGWDEEEAIEIIEEDDEEVFMVVENMPEFPGGDLGLMKYIQKNLKYPPIAKEYNITGKVYISFVVDRSGSVTNVKVVRGVDKNLDAEAIRVVKSFPKYTPGTQRGNPVRVMFTIPINFTLN